MTNKNDPLHLTLGTDIISGHNNKVNRFQVTLIKLQECFNHFTDSLISDEEKKAKENLVKVCQEIINEDIRIKTRKKGNEDINYATNFNDDPGNY
jgi:hypothetical protein